MPPKEPKKRGFSFQGFDVQSYKLTEGYAKAIDELYNKAVQDFSQIASGLKVNPDKPFSFADYPQAKKKAAEIVSELSSNMKAVIIRGSRTQWLYACQKNDEFLGVIMNTAKIPKATLAKYQDKNLDALDAFQKRKIGGMDLSKRIWNYTGQMKDQMELGIDVALGEGKSAQALSRDLRQYLVDPDKLFRRVRDKYGNLKLSKAAQAYHPGQGKYRSSYKNAMRLTRSEINMAYRESDQLRWQQLDFVVGYEIRLSNNHTLNGMPLYDICDMLKGRYPKDFKWKGWHPQCRCHSIPILMSQEDFNTDELNELKAAINGTEYNKFAPKNAVNGLPQEFKDWASDNLERSKGWKSQPYFIRDNFEGGTLAGGLKVAETPVSVKQKAIKTPEQRADIQKRWNARKLTNKYGEEIQSIADEYNDVPSIVNYAQKVKGRINAGASPEEISAMVKKLNHKTDIKALWNERKTVNAVSDLIPNAKAYISQHSLEAIQTVHSAVKTKLATFENMTLEQQLKKLDFEIKFVEDNKKYSTWRVAQDAYKKRRERVLYLLEKDDIKQAASHSLQYAKNTLSTKVKGMAAELNALMAKDAPAAELRMKVDELNKEVKRLEGKKASKAARKYSGEVSFDNSAYTKARKDAAMWAKETSEADKRLRDTCGEVWQGATQKEREAAYYYTHTYSSINEPLRGVTYYGNKSLKESQAKVPHLTSIIDKSYYGFDMWVQRGVDHNGFKGVFGESLHGMSGNELKQFIGKVGVDKGFGSCGVAKGTGFTSNITYNIYCPKGTKMLYAEPFSRYGSGAQSAAWDGISKQSSFGSESEIILRRGTKFRITKVEYNSRNGRYYVDLEVIGQE